MDDPTFEGRLLAHRRILVIILRDLAGTPQGERILSMLHERATLRDGQEDPGAVEAPGLDLGLAVAREYQAILDDLAQQSTGGDAGPEADDTEASGPGTSA